jgi:hypothetical protein
MWQKDMALMAIGSSRVVEHSPHQTKVKGSYPAATESKVVFLPNQKHRQHWQPIHVSSNKGRFTVIFMGTEFVEI